MDHIFYSESSGVVRILHCEITLSVYGIHLAYISAITHENGLQRDDRILT